MFDPAVSDQWWKNAIVYCLDVETFMDSDGDGIGDFSGLTERLPYLDGLGVTCIWLLPFYASPQRDDGYDVSDYYAVDPRLGTFGDMVECLRTATALGIRVIADLVVNHTSSDHPWFQASRSTKDSPYRDWYVWADEKPENEQNIIFPDQEDSNWEWDEQTGQYYFHRFYSSQPDLNIGNGAVRDEIHKIMGFWMELGIAGFRVDGVPYLIETTGIEDEMPDDPHLVLEEMRGFLTRRRGDSVLFGEVNLPPGEREDYFGKSGDQMTGLLNFVLCGAVFAAIAKGDAATLAEHLRDTAAPPRTCQWLTFLRNHDELNLTHLPEEEQEAVMEAFAPEESMRMYGRGVRRRLPSMVDGDRDRMELAYSLLLSLPGTPVFFYGEEIGMAEDLSVEGRLAVRTVMQWNGGRNGGFSSCDPEERPLPLVEDGPFAYSHVNVADQKRDEGSFLNRIERGVRVRKESPELGWGVWTVLDVGDSRVLAHRCDWLDGTVLAVHNLSGGEVEARLDLSGDDFDAVVDIFGKSHYDALDVDDPRVPLEPYGYRWLRARTSGRRRAR